VSGRLTLGTIVLVIVLSPFIVYFISAFTGMLSQFNFDQVRLETGNSTFDSILNTEHSIISNLYKLLTDPKAVAAFLGLGLIMAALKYRRGYGG
jgi:hypothetical protein